MNATWRVAALTMMNAEALQRALSGTEARTWVEAAASCGIVEAEIRLGRMLLEGGDRQAAFACFRSAAKSGDADAHNMLGRCYENGWGIAADAARAVHHYRSAAEKGLDWAQYNLGHMLLDGIGCARDQSAAFAWYMRAADTGHVRAMNLMGRCLEQGWGVAADRSAARNWYGRSARGGYFRGAYNYATLLAGEGCVTGATFWFARALETAPEPTRGRIARAIAAPLRARLSRT
jgi:hypothetical protein